MASCDDEAMVRGRLQRSNASRATDGYNWHSRLGGGGEGLDTIDKELFEVRAAVIDDDQNITSGLPHACVSSFS